MARFISEAAAAAHLVHCSWQPSLTGRCRDASNSARFGHAKRAPLNLGVRRTHIRNRDANRKQAIARAMCGNGRHPR
jgi:hypothetical protein